MTPTSRSPEFCCLRLTALPLADELIRKEKTGHCTRSKYSAIRWLQGPGRTFRNYRQLVYAVLQCFEPSRTPQSELLLTSSELPEAVRERYARKQALSVQDVTLSGRSTARRASRRLPGRVR